MRLARPVLLKGFDNGIEARLWFLASMVALRCVINPV